jgi:hypothetical protein
MSHHLIDPNPTSSRTIGDLQGVTTPCANESIQTLSYRYNTSTKRWDKLGVASKPIDWMNDIAYESSVLALRANCVKDLIGGEDSAKQQKAAFTVRSRIDEMETRGSRGPHVMVTSNYPKLTDNTVRVLNARENPEMSYRMRKVSSQMLFRDNGVGGALDSLVRDVAEEKEYVLTGQTSNVCKDHQTGLFMDHCAGSITIPLRKTLSESRVGCPIGGDLDQAWEALGRQSVGSGPTQASFGGDKDVFKLMCDLSSNKIISDLAEFRTRNAGACRELFNSSSKCQEEIDVYTETDVSCIHDFLDHVNTSSEAIMSRLVVGSDNEFLDKIFSSSDLLHPPTRCGYDAFRESKMALRDDDDPLVRAAAVRCLSIVERENKSILEDYKVCPL